MKIRKYRITGLGKNFLHQYLSGELEDYTIWDEELAYTLSQCEDFCNSEGIFKLPDRMVGRSAFIIKGLEKVKAIEPIEDKIMDTFDEIITPLYNEIRKKERKEKYNELNIKFRQGFGPPPELLGFYEEDEEEG